MKINNEYLLELYNSIKEEDCEMTFEDFIDYIKETIASNMEYDFNVIVDTNELFN